MKKKSMITLLATMSLTAMFLTGCGNDTESVFDEVESSIEETTEESKEETQIETQVETKEETVAEVLEETQVETETVEVESLETVEETTTASGEYLPAPGADVFWSVISDYGYDIAQYDATETLLAYKDSSDLYKYATECNYYYDNETEFCHLRYDSANTATIVYEALMETVAQNYGEPTTAEAANVKLNAFVSPQEDGTYVLIEYMLIDDCIIFGSHVGEYDATFADVLTDMIQ